MTAYDSPAAGEPSADAAARRGLARFATENAVRGQRRTWSRRVASWDQHGSASLGQATAAVLAAAAAGPGAQVADLGCGTGQISLPLAARGCRVLAVDVSPAMIRQLASLASRQSPGQVEGLALPIEELALPPQSLDLVVSSYALHHLRDADKARLVTSAFDWLRPGGQLVIADMMFGRGMSRRDRDIIKSKVIALAKKGPGGYWRIAKNAARYLLRIQERPLPVSKWTELLASSGFTAVTAGTIVAEAGIVTARRPGQP
jgi:2-polyprenyl-3-methyl-5-hydroxy-6-metoxy-1,4-benzoquinol methylase